MADISELLRNWIEIAASGIESLAVVVIVLAIVHGTIRYFIRLCRGGGDDPYSQFKRQLGRALLLGLEFLVAADVIRTVALAPNMENVLILGLLVIIRTFLSWSLVVEIDGRWPWQPKTDSKGRTGVSG
jgi:uncharacterized membrane protein